MSMLAMPFTQWPQFPVPIRTPWYDIGEYTYFSPTLVLKAWRPGERIVIGRFCSIGDHVVIATGGQRRTDLPALFPFSADMYRRTRDTTVGHDVWLGMNSLVVGGVTIGDGAIVAAGAVVLSDVPPFAVVAGNPAQVARYRFSEEIVKRLQRIAWWNWPLNQIAARREWFLKPVQGFVDEFDPERRGDGRG
jgi:virginiamycin A acetyltransferase